MLNFPASPANGQLHAADGRSWQFNSAKNAWLLLPVTNSDAVSAAQSAEEAGESAEEAASSAAASLASSALAAATVASKANIASPTFTGVPAAPTAALGTRTTQLATTAFVGLIGLNGELTNVGAGDMNALPLGSFQAVNGTATQGLTLNWPPSVGTGAAAQYWNVLTFGTATRITQIASFGFAQGNSKTYVRTKHDAIWYPWREMTLGIPSSIDLTGATSATATLQSLLNAISTAGGGEFRVPGGKILLDTSLTVPKNVALIGPWASSPDESATLDYNARAGQLIVNSAATVNVAEDAMVKGFQVIRKNLTLPFADAAAAQAGVATFAGTAFTVTGNGAALENLLVLGFEWAAVSISKERPYLHRVRGDCTNGIRVSACYDIARLSQCHFWPYTTTHQAFSTVAAVTTADYAVATVGALLTRTGKAFVMNNVGDWNTLDECFSFGYRIGYEFDNVANCEAVACGADYYGPIAASVGVGYNVIGATKDLDLIGCRSAGQAKAVVVNSTATTAEAARLTACNFWDNDTYHVHVLDGRVTINGGAMRGGLVGVEVAAASDGASILGVTFHGLATRAFGPDQATLTSTGSVAFGNRLLGGTPAGGVAPIYEAAGQRALFKGGIGSFAGEDLAIFANGVNVLRLGNDTAGAGLRVSGSAAVANWLMVQGAIAGAGPTLIAQGADTNVDINLVPKGAGSVVGVTKAMVGLGAVDNTADTAKPVSTAQQTALDLKANANAGSHSAPTAYSVIANSLTGYYQNNSGEVSLAGARGVEALRAVPVASAVNYLRAIGAITAGNPELSAQGSDTNISLALTAKGTGRHLFASGAGKHFEVGSGATSGVVNYNRMIGSATGVALNLSAEGSDTNVGQTFTAKGTGVQSFTNANGTSLEVGGNAAASVNFLRITGAITAARPTLSAQGSDTNIDLSLLAKGSGRVLMGGANGFGFVSSADAATANRLGAKGTATAVAPQLFAEGNDTNINISFVPKGTGRVQFGTLTANADAPVTGYIEIVDAGGTVRKLAVIA